MSCRSPSTQRIFGHRSRAASSARVARVEAGHDGAELGERRGRLARPAEEMEHLLLLQVAERARDDRGQLVRLVTRAVECVERADVLLGRLHTPASE